MHKIDRFLPSWDFYLSREAQTKNNTYNKQITYVVCATVVGTVVKNMSKREKSEHGEEV